jgi:hypothetical protein
MNRIGRFPFLLATGIAMTLTSSQSASAITIAAAKLLPIGSDVSIDSAVITNTVDLVNTTANANFEIQDSTGGIAVFGSTSFIDQILSMYPAGTPVTLDGPTASFSGLFEIEPNFVNSTSSNVGVPAPIVTTSADYQDLSPTAENLESELVSLANVRFTGLSPGQKFTGLTNYTVTDGVRNIAVRVSTTAQPLVGKPIPSGPVNLTGIFTQFDATNPLPGFAGVGYELALLDNSSITAIPEPSTFVLMTVAYGAALPVLNRRKISSPKLDLH